VVLHLTVLFIHVLDLSHCIDQISSPFLVLCCETWSGSWPIILFVLVLSKTSVEPVKDDALSIRLPPFKARSGVSTFSVLDAPMTDPRDAYGTLFPGGAASIFLGSTIVLLAERWISLKPVLRSETSQDASRSRRPSYGELSHTIQLGLLYSPLFS